MKKINSRYDYSSLNLTEAELPGIKKLEVGGKFRFEIEAELNGVRMEEDYSDMPIAKSDSANMPKPKKKPVASFKIVAVEPLGAVKGDKVSRY